MVPLSLSRRLLFVVAVLVEWVSAVPVGYAEQPIERVSYSCPTWDEAAKLTDVERYSTKSEYLAACNADYALEKVRYSSDGLSVMAYFYHSRNSEQKKRPVIVFNRGSYVRGDIAAELVPIFHRFATNGFAIVAPMYRGSDGCEGHDEMGGADLNDLINIVPVMKQLGSLDTENIFLYGESRGGMMVFQAIRDGFPARAAATLGAFTDLSALLTSDRGAATAKMIWPDFDERRNAIISRRSAIHWSERLTVPLLLMHGGDDHEVAPVQTIQLAMQLAKSKTEFGVTIFPGGDHTLQQYRAEHDRQVIEFFKRYLVK